MNNLDKQYIDLLRDIKENGIRKETRNGVTYSIFGRTIRHDMGEGFPLLTTKKMWFKGIATELLWFLSGNTNIQSLVKQGNNIWVGDAFKRFKEEYNAPAAVKDVMFDEKKFIEMIKTNDEFAEKWGDMGPIYGKQWRDFDGIDQIQNLLDTLINNPDSRRMLVSAWNVGELDDMVLPPCHYGFSVWTRKLTYEERVKYKYPDTDDGDLCSEEHLDAIGVPKRGISLMWRQRSVDTPLGLPFNIASYGLLLLMIASELNMVPLELIGSLEDVHIYENQMEGVEEQLQRKGYDELPEVLLEDGIYSGYSDIHLENYNSNGKIHFPLSN